MSSSISSMPSGISNPDKQTDKPISFSRLPCDLLAKIVGLATDNGNDLKALACLESTSRQLREVCTSHHGPQLAQLNAVTKNLNYFLNNAQDYDRYKTGLEHYFDEAKFHLKHLPECLHPASITLSSHNGISAHDLHLALRGNDNRAIEDRAFPSFADIMAIPKFEVAEIKSFLYDVEHVNNIRDSFNIKTAQMRINHLEGVIPQLEHILRNEQKQREFEAFQQFSLPYKCLQYLGSGLIKGMNCVIPEVITNPILAGTLAFAMFGGACKMVTDSEIHAYVLSIQIGLTAGCIACSTVAFRNADM